MTSYLMISSLPPFVQRSYLQDPFDFKLGVLKDVPSVLGVYYIAKEHGKPKKMTVNNHIHPRSVS